MFKRYSYLDENYFVAIQLRDDLTTVEIRSNITGLSAKAHALRFHGDAYNEDIGINVAHARAVSRLARKNEKYFIRQTEPALGY